MFGTILKKYGTPCFKTAQAFLHYNWKIVGQKNFADFIDPNKLIATVTIKYASTPNEFKFSEVYFLPQQSFLLLNSLHKAACDSSINNILANGNNDIIEGSMKITDHFYGETMYKLYQEA